MSEGARWIEQARRDLDDAALLAEHGRHATACFLAQQAAGKALKGVLYAAGADVVLGHSVRTLCGEVTLLDPQVQPRCPDWGALDQFYIPTRYPDALPGGIPAEAYTASQSAGALATAREVLAFADGRASTE
ncbi:MAG: HEPN domain-containing protein [Actinobacteria bacterium]|nr:HEPN domain-containing protein [Actinomycetota bacterium]